MANYTLQKTGAEIDEALNKVATHDTQISQLTSDVSTARTTAETAQSTANTAKTTAESAASTASTAQSTAESAQAKANENATALANVYKKDESYSRDEIDEMFANFSGSSYADAEGVAF